jgi:hypothetical protein
LRRWSAPTSSDNASLLWNEKVSGSSLLLLAQLLLDVRQHHLPQHLVVAVVSDCPPPQVLPQLDEPVGRGAALGEVVLEPLEGAHVVEQLPYFQQDALLHRAVEGEDAALEQVEQDVLAVVGEGNRKGLVPVLVCNTASNLLL